MYGAGQGGAGGSKAGCVILLFDTSFTLASVCVVVSEDHSRQLKSHITCNVALLSNNPEHLFYPIFCMTFSPSYLSHNPEHLSITSFLSYLSKP